jgi:hypothetical protein
MAIATLISHQKHTIMILISSFHGKGREETERMLIANNVAYEITDIEGYSIEQGFNLWLNEHLNGNSRVVEFAEQIHKICLYRYGHPVAD